MTPARARIVAVVTSVVVALGCASAVGASRGPGTAPVSTTRPSAPTFTPATATSGERVRVSGRLPTRLVRPVVLQRKTAAGTWRRVSRVLTDKRGRYRLRVTAPAASTRYRVKAPTVVRPARRYPALVSATTRLRVSSPPAPGPTPTPTPTVDRVDVQVPASVTGAGPPVGVTVAVSPVVPGEATVQWRHGAGWYDGGSALLGPDGTARISVPVGPLGIGVSEVRAVVSGVASQPRPVEVAAPGAITSPEANAEVTGAFDVDVAVDPALVATGVRLMLDGAVVPGEAQPLEGTPVPGTWRLSVDPAELGVTHRHVDLVAQVRTTHGRALTEAVALELRPSTGGLPPGFRSDTVVAGLDLPTSFAIIDAHRVLVAEKAGLLRLAVDGDLRTAPVLDLRAEVSDLFDAGLLDVTLDPDFATNGWFYLAYVRQDAPGSEWATQQVVRYTLDQDAVVPGSRHVVLGVTSLATCQAEPTTPGCLLNHLGMHTVDDLLFLDDGSLLVSVGDGAAGDVVRAALAQRLDVLAGKVLRIDPATGLGLPDNPYFEPGAPTSNRSRVYAYGFRNPFRMALAPDGEVYVGDVGEISWEEVDRLVAGGNFGWPCFEGNAQGFAPVGDPDCVAVREGSVEHRAPVVAYPHVDMMGSVTLGAFYDGETYPDAYRGRMFLGDYTMGRIWTLDPDEPSPRLEDFGLPPALGAGVEYAMGPDDTIWYADVIAGRLRSLVYDPGETTCPSGQFLSETFRNRLFEPEADGEPWVSSCVGEPPSGPSLVAPGEPNQGEGWSMRWTGSPQLAPGTYHLTAAASGHLEVRVDGELVPSGGTFSVAGSQVDEATADMVITLTNQPDFDSVPYFVDFDWNYLLSWERVGTAPQVRLTGPTVGGLIGSGDTLTWTVSATDAEDGVLGAEALRTDVVVLHYGTDAPHGHPSGTFDGSTGSVLVEDAHAPGKIVYRVTGVAVDSSGWAAESDPVYVCLEGNEVGPCS